MNKLFIIVLMVPLLFIYGCSHASSENIERPDYIKETFDYYTEMSRVVDAVEVGIHIDIATDKYFHSEKEISVFAKTVSEQTRSYGSEEEELVAFYIYGMKANIFLMQRKSFQGDINFSKELYDIQKYRYKLDKVYDEYGLAYKPNN